VSPTRYYNIFYFKNWDSYTNAYYSWCQYFVKNAVLDGLFIPLTPRMAIEGYNDTMLQKI